MSVNKAAIEAGWHKPSKPRKKPGQVGHDDGSAAGRASTRRGRLLARLQREHPDLHERVERGELGAGKGSGQVGHDEARGYSSGCS